MAELADASDSKSDIERCVGSTPTPGTIFTKPSEIFVSAVSFFFANAGTKRAQGYVNKVFAAVAVKLHYRGRKLAFLGVFLQLFAFPRFLTKKPAKSAFKRLRGRFEMVLKRGLEPLSLSAYAPQAYVSTNFTT